MLQNEEEDEYIGKVVELVCNEAMELMNDDEVLAAQSQIRNIQMPEEGEIGAEIIVPKIAAAANITVGMNYNTTLLVTPQFKDFDSFLNIVDIVEDTLNSIELTDYIQVASFHPKYTFAGTTEEAVENFTNKSPFPIIHLLKVQDVTHAIQSYNTPAPASTASSVTAGAAKNGNNVDNVWRMNIKRMKRLGGDELRRQQLATIKEAIRLCQPSQEK